jgi:hypothetical protein
MNIPNKIKIGGHSYIVELTTTNNCDNCNGMTWLKLQKILIDKDLPQDRIESVLIHEVIEVIDNDFELKLPHRTIQVLEEMLYLFIIQNSNIFKEV